MRVSLLHLPPGLAALLCEVTVERAVAHLRVLLFYQACNLRKQYHVDIIRDRSFNFALITKDSGLYLGVDPLCCTWTSKSFSGIKDTNKGPHQPCRCWLGKLKGSHQLWLKNIYTTLFLELNFLQSMNKVIIPVAHACSACMQVIPAIYQRANFKCLLLTGDLTRCYWLSWWVHSLVRQKESCIALTFAY